MGYNRLCTINSYLCKSDCNICHYYDKDKANKIKNEEIGVEKMKTIIKLSELNNEDMLLVGENLVISKEDYIKEMHEHEGEEVYTTTQHKANVDARDMLESALECEANDNMYEDWLNDVLHDIRDSDIEKLQVIVDDILSRSANISYQADKEVEIDV